MIFFTSQQILEAAVVIIGPWRLRHLARQLLRNGCKILVLDIWMNCLKSLKYLTL